MFVGLLFLIAVAVTFVGIVIAAALAVFARRSVAATGWTRVAEVLATAFVWIGGSISFYTAPFFLIGWLFDQS